MAVVVQMKCVFFWSDGQADWPDRLAPYGGPLPNRLPLAARHLPRVAHSRLCWAHWWLMGHYIHQFLFFESAVWKVENRISVLAHAGGRIFLVSGPLAAVQLLYSWGCAELVPRWYLYYSSRKLNSLLLNSLEYPRGSEYGGKTNFGLPIILVGVLAALSCPAFAEGCTFEALLGALVVDGSFWKVENRISVLAHAGGRIFLVSGPLAAVQLLYSWGCAELVPRWYLYYSSRKLNSLLLNSLEYPRGSEVRYSDTPVALHAEERFGEAFGNL
ncbi:hypothetical protein DFP72DRAFT_839333 [Ephemerocybe angulata]|uniref:Uncharacterized protein n=1 Tax=Ephemerocybe angulata TaxID=980116 RepID=A0A8H6MED6_9AGAR|nr:hypothetical protein DFP72DRAFT_839333 [Tulosesus angulatus]